MLRSSRQSAFGLMLLALGLVAILIMALVQLTPATSALHPPSYLVSTLGRYLCYAILAVALDLVWGYCGILSLGHAAFFALGAYAMGMYIARQPEALGATGQAAMPQFMTFMKVSEWPLAWWGFQSFPYALMMALLAPGLLAFAFGWFAFRSRVSGVYLSIITQALTYALMLAFFRAELGFGGNIGLNDFKTMFGQSILTDQARSIFAFTSALALIGVLALARWIVCSKLGKILIAIRDAEMRTRFLGYRVEHYKLFVFTVSAMLAGLGGALYAPQIGIVNPGEFAPANSIEVVIWVAIGGRGTLIGAALGALLVNFAKSFFTGVLPEIWLFALGAIFILTPILTPDGLMGLVRNWTRHSSAPNDTPAVTK